MPEKDYNEVADRLMEQIEKYREEAAAFYNKGNKSAAARARKALKDLMDDAKAEWKDIQERKKSM